MEEHRPVINVPVPGPPEHRCRLLLDKYEEMGEISRKLIQARESLTAAEKLFFSVNKYTKPCTERWAPETQMDMQQRIKIFKQFCKATHEIDKRAGSYKRRLDHEIRLVHQLISAEKAAEPRFSVTQLVLLEENDRLRVYILNLLCLGIIAIVLGVDQAVPV